MVGGGVNSFPGRGDYSSGRNWMKIARIIGFVFFGIYSVLFLMGIFGASIDVGNWISKTDYGQYLLSLVKEGQ